MPLRNWALLFIAFATAMSLLYWGFAAGGEIKQGTGLVIATLLAGAGWAYKALDETSHNRRSVCQVYASRIEAQVRDFVVTLADSELERFRALAPEIAADATKASISVRMADPFSGLPGIDLVAATLSVDSVRHLTSWRSKSEEMYAMYDLVGTQQLSLLGEQRVASYYGYIREFRDDYFDLAHRAAKALARDFPEVAVDMRLLRQARSLAAEN